MAIFTGKDTKLVVQGITGRDGSFHTRETMAYGTDVVAGVTPGKGGQTFEGPDGLSAPIYNSMDQAVRETGANASVVFVPPAFAAGKAAPQVIVIVERLRISLVDTILPSSALDGFE